jgi:hypothetical protein
MRLRSLVSLWIVLLLCPSVSKDVDAGPVVVGDSLTVSVSSSLRSRIPNIEVQARSARTIRRSVLTDNGYDLLSTLGPKGHRQWVIELGTNDAWTATMPMSTVLGDVNSFVGRLRRVMPRGSCVAWILPYIGPPASLQIRRRSQTIARAITTAVGRLECGFTVDWPRIASRNPALLEPDGVHLSPKGMLRFVELVAKAVSDMRRHPAASD